MKFNMGIDVEPQMVKMNAQLETCTMLKVEHLLKEFKYVFAWTSQVHIKSKLCYNNQTKYK
jgi:hypothetical protein